MLARDPAPFLGPYRLQAMIAAEHVRAADWRATDWRCIRGLYDLLSTVEPSPIVELNRAVAVAYAESAQAGLALLDELQASAELEGYPPLFSARAELLRRADRTAEARRCYQRAIELTHNETERRYLAGKLDECGSVE